MRARPLAVARREGTVPARKVTHCCKDICRCSNMSSVADVFEILGDPTRRRLVEALRMGERSVSELVEAVDIGQPGVSRQLAILEEARFVRVRPDGRRRLYALRPEPFRELDNWMSGYRDLWQARLDRFAAELDRRRKARAKDRGRRT